MWSVRTTNSVYSASISTENLISLVVMARMLMPLSASALKARAATPARSQRVQAEARRVRGSTAARRLFFYFIFLGGGGFLFCR